MKDYNLVKKSHTCEESGNHLRISVWNLLINKKHNYLLKKLLKWANKKCKNFNIYTVYFFKKNKEKHLDLDKLFFYICAPKKSWYDLQFLIYRVRQTEIGNCDSVLVMSRTHFRVNLHSIVVWMSRNPLLEAGAKSEV